MTLNEIQLTEYHKPPAVCTKPLRGFVFPRYARPHQFLGGSAAHDFYRTPPVAPSATFMCLETFRFPGLFVAWCRSSHPEVFLRKRVLKICSKFTAEHPCWNAISIKLQSKLQVLKNTSGRLLLLVPYIGLFHCFCLQRFLLPVEFSETFDLTLLMKVILICVVIKINYSTRR